MAAYIYTPGAVGSAPRRVRATSYTRHDPGRGARARSAGHALQGRARLGYPSGRGGERRHARARVLHRSTSYSGREVLARTRTTKERRAGLV